jgi:hypothetical protein
MPRRTSSRSRSSRGRGFRGTSGPAGVFDLFLRPQRSLPARIIGLLIRLRAEIFLLTVFVTIWVLLSKYLPPWGARTTVVAVLVLMFAVPASRRYVTARLWCVSSRHRVRAALLNSRYSSSMTYDGKLPYLLWSRPSPTGERIRVWLPAGLSVKDLERSTDALAAACWARSARFTPIRGQAALVVLDIIRRDPLDGTIPVQSDTTGDAGDTPDDAFEPDADAMGQLIPLPARDPAGTAVSGPDHDTPAPPAPRPASSGKARTAATANTETPSARGVGGMDVSDYV